MRNRLRRRSNREGLEILIAGEDREVPTTVSNQVRSEARQYFASILDVVFGPSAEFSITAKLEMKSAVKSLSTVPALSTSTNHMPQNRGTCRS